MYKIVEKKELNSTTTLMKVVAPRIAAAAKAGQFIIFKLDEYGERVPLTIADTDKVSKTVTIIFQKIGAATMALGALCEGDDILDFVGPLGKPTELSGLKSVCIVGGGVGCAIAYPQAKYLFLSGCRVDLIAGFRNKDIVMLEDEMKAVCTNLYLTTDDGSYKNKGFVTDMLKNLIESGNKYDAILSIGPIPMMRAISELTRPYGIKTIVSLNPIMIDGTGMCGGCRVSVGGEIKFACVDGPDFDAHLVDFELLMKRNNIYKQQETADKEHECRLTSGVENA